MQMKWPWMLVLVFAVSASACDTDVFVFGDAPAPPINLDATYYAGVVTVRWELSPSWDGESFRVYSRRTEDPDFFFIAEVTNCVDGACFYDDANVVGGVTYEYYVAAVDPDSGEETASESSVVVAVPFMDGPPAPELLSVVALDGAAYLLWSDNARQDEDFSFYRVYQGGDGASSFLVGETDSEAFLDERATNGETVRYFVAAVDVYGHEGDPSALAQATPRPDFHGEWLYDYFARPQQAGFRFQVDDQTNPVVSGDDARRHFRFEVDASGWWLVPGPGTEVYPAGFETTALRCGPGADAGCTELAVAPTLGYVTSDLALEPQTTYALRVVGDDGASHYAAVRVTLLGFDQNDDAIMIFDWAYQLQPGNPNLAPAR